MSHMNVFCHHPQISSVANTQIQTHGTSSSSVTFVSCFVLSRYQSVCSCYLRAYFSHFCLRLPTVFQRLSLNTRGMLQMCRLGMHPTHHTSLFITLPFSFASNVVSYRFWLFGVSKQWSSANSHLIQ